MMMSGRNVRGVTMIEMMATLVILAVIITLGIPSIQDFISRQGVVNDGNRLLADIRYARVEASRRGADITVCAFDTTTDCDGSPACSCRFGAGGRDYNLGWLVFVDTNDDQVMSVADGDQLLRVGPATTRTNLEMRGSNLTIGGFKFSQTGALHSDDFDAQNNGVAFTSCEDAVSTTKVPGRRIFIRPAGNFFTEKMGDGDSCSLNRPM